MALHQYPLDKTFLVAAWLEAVLYGIYFPVFWFGVYLNRRRGFSSHQRVLFIASVLMFTIASLHLAINCFRMIRGYVDLGRAPGGPVAFLGVISNWSHILQDVLYTVQSLLGDGMAILRCWILWNRQYKLIILPSCLLTVSFIAGTMVTVGFARIDPTASIFDPRLARWITVFFSCAVTQNVLTTGLMALRLWLTERRSAQFRWGRGVLLPIIRILVESASLYLFLEILLLALYSVNYNVQYIVLETVTPVIGITFGMITIRVMLRAQRIAEGKTEGNTTIGSMPMHRLAVSITTRVEEDTCSPQYDPFDMGKSMDV
ncbi:hypothetical protein C8R46DRAFT_1215064 [Mycena filopes]|nr:hypothetical protein C8R46DRAFT_1215064 [Mycena filopes]